MECLNYIQKASCYPKSDLPVHIHVHISADGYKSYGIEFLFDDDERLVGNIREKFNQEQLPGFKTGKVLVPFCAAV